MEQVRTWVAALPTPVMRRLADAGVCIWTLPRLVDWNREWGATWQPPGWPVAGYAALERMEGLFTEGAWREGRRPRPAVFIAEEWKPLNQWVPNASPYCLYHEIGHALGVFGGRPRPHWHPDFRRVYLQERLSLIRSPDPRLRYFLGHWCVGITEVFAEGFTGLHTTLASDGQPEFDALFRRAFPRSIEHVRQLLISPPLAAQ
jgi:hypothetical protein